MIDFSRYPHIPIDRRVVLQDFYAISVDPGEPARIRAYFHTTLQMLLSAESDTEQIINAAQEIGYRLPEFDGDLMGRPADDE